MAMIKKSFAMCAIFLLVISILSALQVEVVDANPTWGTSATPIPPITDPPQITITSPNSIEYSNPVPLNITIIQPDSWVNKTIFVLPNGWVDNSDSSNSVVVGQNKLMSITCIIDGQSIIFWKGTPVGYGITYYLPKVTQFSATMTLSKGQHSLQVNVLAVSDYVVEGIIPFAGRQYNISASQSTTFRVEDGSDAPMIDNIKSSYVIWQSSSESMPSSTIAPPQSLNPAPTPSPIPTSAPSPTASPYTPSPSPSPIPTSTPSVPEFSWLVILPLFLSILFVVVLFRKRKLSDGYD
jgi:hypothetical protein